MAVGRAVQPVDRVGRHVERRREAEARVRPHHVVVDRLGESDDVETGPGQAQRVLGCASSAKAHQRVQPMLLVVADDRGGHVRGHSVDEHLVRLVPARPQDRASGREDPGQLSGFQRDVPILDEPPEPVAESHQRHPVVTDRGLADASDRGVEAGTVAARRQDPDAFPACHRSAPLALPSLPVRIAPH